MIPEVGREPCALPLGLPARFLRTGELVPEPGPCA